MSLGGLLALSLPATSAPSGTTRILNLGVWPACTYLGGGGAVSSSRGWVRGLSPHPVKAPAFPRLTTGPEGPSWKPETAAAAATGQAGHLQQPQGPAAGSIPGKFQSRAPAPSRVLGPRGCAKPVPASALHRVYKPLSDLGLDAVGTPFFILNARHWQLRLRAAVGPIPGESRAGSVPGHRGRGTGWERAPWGTSLLLASLSRLLIWKQRWLLPGPWAFCAQ